MMGNRRAPRGSDSRAAVEEDRMPRETTTREHDLRFQDSYTPPSVLPEPDPVDGMTFRWVRSQLLNNADNRNVSQRLREGWEPVQLKDHPELQLQHSDEEGKFAKQGLVEMGGLVLCKMPTERVEARKRFYQRKSDAAMNAVDQNMFNEQQTGAPMGFEKPERRTETRFGPDSRD